MSDEAESFASELPRGFLLGASSSALQSEGGVHDGGRELSVWDEFSHRPGRTQPGRTAATPDVAARHYERVVGDVRLLADLGVDVYRFSFGWPRLQPRGQGSLNREGIAFYDRLLDALLAAGISPMATLFHWDTPLELRGSWLNRDTAMRFGDYANQVGEVFGDRIDRWVTVNEPATVMLNGYALGIHAPATTLLFDALPAGHNLLLGHGQAVQGLRAASVRGQIGIANVSSPVEALTSSDDDTSAAGLYDLLHNTMFGDAVLRGRYPDVPEQFATELRPLVEADVNDLASIHQPLDFYGLTYWYPTRVGAKLRPVAPRAGAPAPVDLSNVTPSLPLRFAPWPDFPRTASGWPNAPEFLAVALTELATRYGEALPPVFLVGGGAAVPEKAVLDADTGTLRISDPARIDYLTAHLAAALAATAPSGPASSVDLRGYLVHTLLDGFEWSDGYATPFGLVHVDRETGDRTPKQSFAWLRRVLESRS